MKPRSTAVSFVRSKLILLLGLPSLKRSVSRKYIFAASHTNGFFGSIFTIEVASLFAFSDGVFFSC